MEEIKAKIVAAAIPGIETGKMTLLSADNLEHPSIRAASSRSLGMVLKYP